MIWWYLNSASSSEQTIKLGDSKNGDDKIQDFLYTTFRASRKPFQAQAFQAPGSRGWQTRTSTTSSRISSSPHATSGGGGRGGRGGGGERGRGRGGGRGGAPAPPQAGHGQQASHPIAILSNIGVADRQALRKHLYRVRLRLTHRPSRRLEMFDSLTATPATQTKFDRNGELVSVAAYFKDTYNYTIRFPHKFRGQIGFVLTSPRAVLRRGG
ncbi:hypothetical protein A4X06_0g3834 [Tilletia controversa]|uniref:PAZ domain-containing protein n=2 Tax=Tilletia TaxID=13289 RepID=A0A8X7MUL3_9BASI|nr:hypothetical protein CF336_g6645 [Tilletia laevis]KAE8191690.1 hypothetical protein CF335_g6019 [Tilletia laevis]KAE8248274.1 hypothetical protein A4X06_0g3834 [Tilletia controversa]CAD6920037.1 unnamed protein product [Tilletia caries]